MVKVQLLACVLLLLPYDHGELRDTRGHKRVPGAL
jgi:hypothetical protein